MAQNAGEAMTEDEAIERVIAAVSEISNGSDNGSYSLRAALREFAAAIRKQAKADMACLLLTRESEAMGGYDGEGHAPGCGDYTCVDSCRAPSTRRGP